MRERIDRAHVSNRGMHKTGKKGRPLREKTESENIGLGQSL